MQILQSPFGGIKLCRYPREKDNTLRAWDAADEYLLQECHARTLNGVGRILILNDSFGALSLSLSEFLPTVMTDSCLSLNGILRNMQQNGIDPDSVTLLDSMQQLPGTFDLVLIKLPKSQAMLEHQLCQISQCVNKHSVIIGAAMAKNIHTSTLNLFERVLGQVNTSLAKKKARLIYCDVDEQIRPQESPFPKQLDVEVEGRHYTLLNHANVFSRDKLDIGSRFFLQNMPSGEYKSIVDLGCGNGILALHAATLYPGARFSLIDESYMAIASARANMQVAYGDNIDVQFFVDDCLSSVEIKNVDLVLNNPPFHIQHAVGGQVAWRMFRDAFRVLKPGGELWVIGNRHLAYHIKLKRLFGNCVTVTSNNKFVILRARKRK